MTRSVTASRCPGPLTRRSWLQIGGLSLGALAGGLDPRLAGVRIEAICDVDNPLLGERGAAQVYAPQKGATRWGPGA